MNWRDLMPTKLKWLKHIPVILTDKVLTFVKGERRWWVLTMIFVVIISVNFRDVISRKIDDFDPVKDQLITSQMVNDRLSHVLEGTAGSRAYIFQFHNGVTYYTGKHAQRFTCTYEIVTAGVSREANNLQNLQVSIFSWWISETLAGRMIYEDVATMPDLTTRVTLEQQGIQSILCLPLIHRGKVVGILGVDYVGRHNPFIDGLVLNEWIKNEANIIAKMIGE